MINDEWFSAEYYLISALVQHNSHPNKNYCRKFTLFINILKYFKKAG